MNKKYAFAFLSGFALATIAFFTMGQSRRSSMDTGPYSIAAGSDGVYVCNTHTGETKFISAHVPSGSMSEFGKWFDYISPVSPKLP